jgi:tRNA (cytidine/uridine-2'-O-)-methyltransferase
MDYYKKCKIIIHLSFEDFIETKNKKRIILFTTKAKKIYYNFEFKRDDTILFGRGSIGVPDYVNEIVNERLKIPISKDTRSLNVVTSVSVVLSEALRQNNYSNI